jgi:UDP-N-acetylmuramate dehydrogenase
MNLVKSRMAHQRKKISNGWSFFFCFAILIVMTVQHNVSLKDLSTMGIGGTAAHLAYISSREDIPAAAQWAGENNVGVFVLGEGSNTVFSDANHNLLILKMQIHGMETIAEDETSVTLQVGAGEHWDGLVAKAVGMNLSGIEALSMIPGTVGAAPVQNIGAYGQEISRVVTEIEAFDTQSSSFVTIPTDQCGFTYRSSMFKDGSRGRYIICSVTIQLSKEQTLKPPYYQTLQAELDTEGIKEPTLGQIREAVMAVRAKRLPDPSVVPNCGSFFENPIVDPEVAQKLGQQHPDMPSHPAGNQVKLQAGWLVEQCGFKGQSIGKIVVFKESALVLTNPHGGSFADLKAARDQIIKAVQDKFGVTLVAEPQLIE